MIVVPLAEESLGVRSMALFVETKDVKVLIDPGVSLAPYRYGLPPHPREFKALAEARKRIIDYARRSDLVILSHYHYDHYTPPFDSLYTWTDRDTYVEVYDRKIVVAKDYRTSNFSQRKRGYTLVRSIEGLAEIVRLVDSWRESFGDTTIETTSPLHHGLDGTPLGTLLGGDEFQGVEKSIRIF